MIGIDPARSAVRDAAEHVCALFALATGENLPFADESFDSVVCSEVLEHVGDANAVMAEASRVPRPGGALVFSLPNRTLLSKLIVIDLAQRNRITRALPHDIHEWGRFIGSRDLGNSARRHDLVVHDVRDVFIRVRDVPAAALAMVALRRNRINYAEAGSRVRLHLGRSHAVAYVGYALKTSNGRDRSPHRVHIRETPTNIHRLFTTSNGPVVFLVQALQRRKEHGTCQLPR